MVYGTPSLRWSFTESTPFKELHCKKSSWRHSTQTEHDMDLWKRTPWACWISNISNLRLHQMSSTSLSNLFACLQIKCADALRASFGFYVEWAIQTQGLTCPFLKFFALAP